jgi:hypothetical protein
MGVAGALPGPAGTATFGGYTGPPTPSGLMGMGANADGTLFIAVREHAGRGPESEKSPKLVTVG